MKRRLLFVHHAGGLGGASVSLFHILEMLQSEYDLTILCPAQPAEVFTELQQKGFHVKDPGIKTPMYPFYSGGLRWWNLKFWYLLYPALLLWRQWQQVIRQEQPDLVLLNSMTLCWLVPLVKRLGIPSACFVRETMPEAKFGVEAVFLKGCLRQCNGLFYLTERDRQEFNCQAPVQGIVADCIRQEAYQGLEDKAALQQRFQLDSRQFNVLFVGGMRPITGFHVLLDALGELADVPLKLVVAGNVEEQGSYAEAIHAQIRQQQLERKIDFVGVCTEMPPLFGACDVLVFPSTFPHQARPVFEAGMAGVPVIISDFPQTSGLVQAGVNGLVFRPNDAHDLAAKLRELYASADLRNRLGANNRTQALEEHEFQKVKASLLFYLSEIFGMKGRQT